MTRKLTSALGRLVPFHWLQGQPYLKQKNYTEHQTPNIALYIYNKGGDMMETYKILSGKYERSAMPVMLEADPTVA